MICEGITAGKVGNYLLIVCWNYGRLLFIMELNEMERNGMNC